MDTKLRVIIADDERPARSFLAAMLKTFPEVSLVGEASNGAEAIEQIEREKPDLALLDLQMPEIDGLGVVRMLRKDRLPLIAFVTAYDEYAVRAFELHAVDYLLKPVIRSRLQETLIRAHERLEKSDFRAREAASLEASINDYETNAPRTFLARIPVRHRGDIILLPVDEVASIVSEGELLHLTTIDNRRFSITHSLKELEARLDPELFVRLSRGTLASIGQIDRISPLPGGTYVVTLRNKQELNVSRLQARVLRERILKL
ncbi:MAG: response regulator [Acidobacteria bacterium]|nr:response regulator [Acidobacteriota bacterium]